MPTPPLRMTQRLRGTWRRLLARVYYGQAAAGASDYARALVPTRGEEHMRPGEFIQQARRFNLWAHEVMQSAVLLERAYGASWAQVAAAFGYTEDYVKARWEPIEQAWLDGSVAELAEGLTVESLVEPPSTRGEALKIAEQLDQWVRQGAGGQCPEDNPVSRGLPDD
jgi:hypothetical protein